MILMVFFFSALTWQLVWFISINKFSESFENSDSLILGSTQKCFFCWSEMMNVDEIMVPLKTVFQVIFEQIHMFWISANGGKKYGDICSLAISYKNTYTTI